MDFPFMIYLYGELMLGFTFLIFTHVFYPAGNPLPTQWDAAHAIFNFQEKDYEKVDNFCVHRRHDRA